MALCEPLTHIPHTFLLYSIYQQLKEEFPWQK